MSEISNGHIDLTVIQKLFQAFTSNTSAADSINLQNGIKAAEENINEKYSEKEKNWKLKEDRMIKTIKDLEQKVELSNLNIKGKKGHASGGRVSLSAGGLAGMLGE